MNGQNGGKLGGSLIGLAVFQIIQTLFWLLLSLIMMAGAFAAIDENGNNPDGFYTSTQKIYLVLIPIALLVLLFSLIFSTVFIFLKKKIGIVLSYISVGAAIIVPLLAIAYFSYLESESNPSDEFGVGAIVIFALVGCIFWGTQLVLLTVSPTRRNIRESF